MKKLVITPQKIEELDLTTEDISQREIDLAQFETEKTARETLEAATATKKASGKQKLLDLGLSEEEVQALIGV